MYEPIMERFVVPVPPESGRDNGDSSSRNAEDADGDVRGGAACDRRFSRRS